MNAPTQPNGPAETPARRSGLALGVALVVLVAFGAFVWYMIGRVEADDVTWARLGWLFGSVEAIAFGAAGVLFGSSVQRDRAEKAEKVAEAHRGDAIKGRVLADRVKAGEPRSPGRVEVVERGGAGDGGERRSRLAELERLAWDPFPD